MLNKKLKIKKKLVTYYIFSLPIHLPLLPACGDLHMPPSLPSGHQGVPRCDEGVALGQRSSQN